MRFIIKPTIAINIPKLNILGFKKIYIIKKANTLYNKFMKFTNTFLKGKIWAFVFVCFKYPSAPINAIVPPSAEPSKKIQGFNPVKSPGIKSFIFTLKIIE